MKYNNATLTNAGASLLQYLTLSQGTLTITCIRTGNGTYSEADNLKTRTRLKSPMQEVQATQVERDARNQIQITSVVTNEGVRTGYPITEMGIFALNEHNQEILIALAVCYSKDEADYMPADDLDFLASINLFSYIKVSNTMNVTTVSDTGYAALADFLITKHKVNSISVSDDGAGNVVVALPL